VTRQVVVVGAGACGTAAAYAAAQSGARVCVVGGRPGATSLGSGALDDRSASAQGDDRAAVRAFVDALDIWELASEACFVATSSGVVRKANGKDCAVLDLGCVSSGVVAVLDTARRGWDATILSKAWTDDPWSRARGLRFEPVRVEVLRFADEAWLPAPDLAGRHDDPERMEWLAERLTRAPELRDKSAIVMEPWLGVRAKVAHELKRQLGMPVGEPLSMPGGAPGLRFELARDDLLARSGVARTVRRALAVSMGPDKSGPRVELDSGVLGADAVILAVGGLVGGGIGWASAAGIDPSGVVATDQGFALSLVCNASLALGGKRLLPAGSPRGALFETFAWSGQPSSCGFERVGVWTDAAGRVRDADGRTLDWLYAAGDAVADAPRTLLQAIRSGLAVGALAARDRGG